MTQLILTNEIHADFEEDLCNLLEKYAGKLTPVETLAVGAYMVGKLVAFQNPRTHNAAQCMAIVDANLELGNKNAIDRLASMPHQGTA